MRLTIEKENPMEFTQKQRKVIEQNLNRKTEYQRLLKQLKQRERERKADAKRKEGK